VAKAIKAKDLPKQKAKTKTKDLGPMPRPRITQDFHKDKNMLAKGKSSNFRRLTIINAAVIASTVTHKHVQYRPFKPRPDPRRIAPRPKRDRDVGHFDRDEPEMGRCGSEKRPRPRGCSSRDIDRDVR